MFVRFDFPNVWVAVAFLLVLFPARARPNETEPVLVTIVDSHLREVERQIEPLKSPDNQVEFSNINRLENNVKRVRSRFDSYRTSSTHHRLDQLLKQIRDTRETVSGLRSDVREEMDDQLVDVDRDGIDWDEFREERMRDSGRILPATLEFKRLYERLTTTDRLLERMREYLTRNVQIKLTESKVGYQWEFLRRTLNRSFEHYVRDQMSGSPSVTLSNRVYRTVIKHSEVFVKRAPDTTFSPTANRRLGHELQRQGRFLIDLADVTDVTGEHQRVLRAVNRAVKDLLPNTSRYDALER